MAAFRKSLASAKVVDGPATPNVQGDVVWVGITPDEPNTDASDDIAGLAANRESFDVSCLARSWSGSADVAAQRTRTYALITGVRSALADDITLGGAVTRARFAGSLYQPYYTEQGQLVVDVVFRIRVDAFN